MDESTVTDGTSVVIDVPTPAPRNGTVRYTSIWPTLSYFTNRRTTNRVSTQNGDVHSQAKPAGRRSYGINALHPNTLFINFDRHDERVYKAYLRRQRLGVLPVLVTMSFMHAIQCLVLDLVPGYRIEILDRIIVVSVAAVLVHTFHVIIILSSFGSAIPGILSSIIWLILTVQIFYDIATSYPRHMPSDLIGWVLIQIFVTQTTTPLGAWLVLPVVLTLVIVHCIIVGVLWSQDSWKVSDLANQMAANILLFAASASLGFAASLFSERLNRRSVLETKSALIAKAKIEMAYKNKERLLLSVLPKHVADEMLKDVGNLTDGQFRKIYMKRYEDVSILFADIVGFTAISSTVTAAELVKILNELFASFDVLANKFHQVRIKILGDCYYCICGALEPRSDHAVLCIHMGLSMVDAISSVRQSTGKDVNMRVGVHTGACLGGVLGQRQWQFDVLGKEVTLANKMESGGLAGRVHVSQATKTFLDGEFELEDGHGGDREDELRLKNITTYFVKSVLKPYPDGTLDKQESATQNGVTTNGKNGKMHRSSKDGGTSSGKAEASDDEEDNATNDLTNEHEQRKEFSKRLQRELIAKDNVRELREKFHSLTYIFRDNGLEQRYQQRSESYSGLPVVALCAALLLTFIAKMCVLPRNPLPVALFVVGEIVLILMAIVSMTLTFASRFPPSVVWFATSIDKRRYLRILWGISTCLVFFICDTVPVAECDQTDENLTSINRLEPDNPSCHFIVYFAHSAIIVFIAISSIVNINHMIKFVMIFIVAGIHCLIILVLVGDPFHDYDLIVYKNPQSHVHIKYRLIGQIISVAAAINYYNSQMEFTARKLYLWKEISKKEKETAADMKLKNESLVYNLLPAHVAKDFLGKKKNDTELYSHSYDEVGVLFAACPNFNSFYNESSFNNNGLECLRFLNEIISDYDELLNLPQFSGIVKIKTVGSTYMAASGMVNTPAKQSLSIKEKWSHLNVLVQFALALEDAINKINEQSFNTFILRIGINHGPIIAGVIGARKPHYDIWGNTVNVSSRMESTGQPGKIQVVEETKNILEQFGYTFEKRGLIKVKGKGELMTYFMENKPDANNSSGMPSNINGSLPSNGNGS